MDLSITTFCLFCLSFGMIGAVRDTPVLMWSSEPLMNNLPEVESLDPIKTTSFHEKYLSPLLKDSKQSLVAFLQDKLHVDDFTRYADVYASNSEGGAFKNVKQLMEDKFSLEMPQVLAPHMALDKLKESFPGDVHRVSSLKDLESLNLGSGKQFLLLVTLKPLANTFDEEKTLSQNDDMIGNVAAHLEKKGIKYTGLFTGRTSDDSQADDVQVYTGRHLLAEAENVTDGVFMNVSSQNIFVYLRNVTVCVHQTSDTSNCGVHLVMHPDIHTADESVSTNSTASVVLTFLNEKSKNSSSSLYNVTITTKLYNQNDSWIIGNTTLSMTGHNVSFDNVLVTPYGLDSTIPFPYSFHCTNFKLDLETVYHKNMSYAKGTYIQLDGFQLQAFRIQNNQFFNAQDCVGFFNTAIWMGLVPAALLLIILISGTMMLLNLSVMDRFDDPKRKTITVSASD